MPYRTDFTRSIPGRGGPASCAFCLLLLVVPVPPASQVSPHRLRLTMRSAVASSPVTVTASGVRVRSSGCALIALRVHACAACRRASLICAPRSAAGAALPQQLCAASPASRLHAFPSRVLAASVPALDEHKLDAYLDTLKWDDKGLVVAIAQVR